MAQYTLDQALRAQAVLREAAGAGEEQFDDEQLIGMLSDEIRMLRETGTSDDEIAAMLREKGGLQIDEETIGRFYVDTSEYGQSLH